MKMRLLCDPKMPMRLTFYRKYIHRYSNRFQAASAVQPNNHQLLDTFSQNSPYAPDGNLDAKQVSGISEMQAKYSDYTCIGSKITVKIHPVAANSPADSTMYMLCPFIEGYIPNQWRDVVETSRQLKNCKQIKMYYSGTGSLKDTVASATWSWKMTPVTKGDFLNHEDYKATEGKEPNINPDYAIRIYKKDNSLGWTSPVWDYDVEIKYIVVWQTPKHDLVTG